MKLLKQRYNYYVDIKHFYIAKFLEQQAVTMVAIKSLSTICYDIISNSGRRGGNRNSVFRKIRFIDFLK